MRTLVLATAVAALFAAGTAHASVHRHVLGYSLDGRPIVAYELGDPASARTVLVVGCVHGNEYCGTYTIHNTSDPFKAVA